MDMGRSVEETSLESVSSKTFLENKSLFGFGERWTRWRTGSLGGIELAST